MADNTSSKDTNQPENEEILDAEQVLDEPSAVDETPDDPDEISEDSPEAVAATEDFGTEPQKSGGFLPSVFGGVIAAGIGFGAAQFMPQIWPDTNNEVTAQLATDIAGHAERLSELNAVLATQGTEIAAIAGTAAKAADLSKVVDTSTAAHTDIAAQFQRIDETLGALETRLTEVEKRPIAGAAATDSAVAAYERELTAMRETLAAQRSQIETVAQEAEVQIARANEQATNLQASAEATANAALMRAALLRIDARLENGGGFVSALSDLAQASGQTADPELLAAAQSGVATLAQLQRDFPAAARLAISAAVAETADDTTMGKLGAFLRTQTGARSLSAREGDDPDAILSRAEAALKTGDIPTVLAEIETLPQSGRDEMASWVTAAQYRIDTVAAVTSLVDATATE